MLFSPLGKQFKPKDAIDLISAVQSGSTLILENVDRYSLVLGDFLNRLSEEISQGTRFNMYLSFPNNQGYKNHYDTQDFFILQVLGYKEWWIFPETISSVSFYQKVHGINPPPKNSLYLHCKLGPGDVLYVPRGHWHYAIACGEPSMHLTLAMFVKTGIDFMKWFADELTDHEEFRRALPIILSSKYGHQAQNDLAGFGELKSKLIEVLNEEDLFKRFLEFKTAKSCYRQPFSFPSHITLSLDQCIQAVSFQRRSQVTNIFLDSRQKKVRLICGGRILTYDSDAEPILRFVFCSDKFTKQELITVSNGMQWTVICSIIFSLIKEGFISIKE